MIQRRRLSCASMAKLPLSVGCLVRPGFLSMANRVGHWGLRAGPDVEGVCLGEFGRVPRIIQLIQLHPEGPGPEHGRPWRTGWLPEPEVVISIRSVHRSDLGWTCRIANFQRWDSTGTIRDVPPAPYQQVRV